ncbi:hypothetical protein PM082_017568 [Marasmius tenuissimus]|nr:hypothetical protein PM082_017568 [Marasmius tenuissimus]
MARHGPLSSRRSSDSQDQDEDSNCSLLGTAHEEEAKSGLLGTETPAMSPEARAPGILSAFWDRIWDDYGDDEDWDDWSLHKRTMWILLLPLKATVRTLDYSFSSDYDVDTRPRSEQGNIFSSGSSKVEDSILIFVPMLFVAVILGVFHCIPIMLNYYDFPGHTMDHYLWTVFALLTAIVPLGAPILVVVVGVSGNLSVNWVVQRLTQRIARLTIILSLVFIYPIVRIALMVLAVKQLTDLPPPALQQVEWTSLIPQFGV